MPEELLPLEELVPDELLDELLVPEELPPLEELVPDELPPEELTMILKEGNELEFLPSLTLSTMLEYIPVCVLLGVPYSRPLALLKVAQVGLFWTEKASIAPLGLLADG